MKSNSVRAAGIVLAVILGVAALLYLGGLISQLTIGYQKWLADGGMTGKATMGAIYFSPLACWRSAMTGSGLKCTLFTAVLAGGLFAFVRLQNRFGSNDYDPRNFTRSKRGTYGTSGWMSEKEMRSVLEVAGPERAKGIILGKTERGSVICLPEDTRLNKHIAVFGASGTMKSRGVIRPALFQSIRRGESVVVADPKSEMFADTAELFKKHGYKVRVYKPGHTVAFSTYAYRLIRNEIYTELERATRRGREVATDPAELPCTVLDDDTPEQREACSALLARLERAEAGAAGVTAKGFQAIRMLMDGYTNREIGEMFGVPANHVTAWVSRARKALGASE